ncbi:YCF48-related protein [Polaromonas sp.]|uniref:WD40/YVTN/BNR-like repeat-containing protein n=1 Tax=Polaromonas sp. TaxID=1869339 RepID=UPI0032647A36
MRKNTFLILLLAGSLGSPAAGIAQPTPATAAATTPILAPARLAHHATQAMLLASTRAGPRFVAVGDHGVVLLSDDGGKTHRQAKSVPVDSTLTSVSFVDARQGWAAGHAGVIIHTTDGGETWVVQRSDVREDRPLFAVHFFDAAHGVAVGLWSLVVTTHDGGITWQTVKMPIPEGAKKADLNLLGLFVDQRGRIFAAAEKGMVLRSDDQGQRWNYLTTGYKGSFWTGTATQDGTLLVAGMRGSLYRSGNDGRSWERIETGSKSSITSLAASAAHVVAVGLDGLMLDSDDAGSTFTAHVRSDHLPLTTLTLDDKGQPILYSRQGVATNNPTEK